MSIDSKQKILKQQAKMASKKPNNCIFDQQSSATLKHKINNISHLISNSGIRLDYVSNFGSDQSSKQNIKCHSNSDQQHQKLDKAVDRTINKNFMSLRLEKVKVQLPVVGSRCPYNLKKIPQKCCICKKKAKLRDSNQLACTHRLHHNCQHIMLWRMKYRCDLCDRKTKDNKNDEK